MKKEGFQPLAYIGFAAATLLTLTLCVCAGSVALPPLETLGVIGKAILGIAQEGARSAIILSVRLPRVLCVALSGAALALCGGVMQGLLRNPLADGSTLGVSAGASLGAVAAIAFGASVPFLRLAGTMAMAMLSATLSLGIILALSYRLDRSFSSHTIILIGIIYSMFVSGILSLLIAFSGEKLRTITYWTMGSLQGSTYLNAAALLAALLVFGGVMLFHARELNAFAVGEANARSVGVNVKRVRLLMLICASALIGVCVSIGGTIAFVGLVTPHILRLLTGPNHKKLLPATVFGGAIFLMLADLLARVIVSPLELPIGVVTSLIGAAVFTVILLRGRKGDAHA
ncbi:MAG: iron ABC transporter permease [Clostridiales bacterium]|nr:iron ABC transporter permease [Clostridiales bacterium]